MIGIPHPQFGEVPRAFVVKKPHQEVSETEIQDFVADKVAPFKKIAGGVHFLDAIPKNNTGKIMRRTLKEKYCWTITACLHSKLISLKVILILNGVRLFSFYKNIFEK